MSWLKDQFTAGVRAWGDAWNDITSLGGNYENDVSKFFDREVVNKADLRASQLGSIISGLPYAGDFIRGINGVEQLEDLYNKTGKTPAYIGGTDTGGSGIGQGLNDIAKGFSRKIEEGTHSLHQFYSGEAEVDPNKTNSERMFRYMSENTNNRHGGPQ